MSRAPIARIKETNGHARYYKNSFGTRHIGFAGNLIIESEQKISHQELLKRLKELAQDYGNDFAIVITRLESQKPETLQERYQRFFQRGEKTVLLLPSPLNIYKLNLKANSIELIKGLDFSQVTPRILRDIVITGDTEYVYNFVYRDDNGNEYPVSVVAPAVLIEEMDLVQKKGEIPKLPIVSRP